MPVSSSTRLRRVRCTWPPPVTAAVCPTKRPRPASIRAVKLALQLQQVQAPDPSLGKLARWVKMAGLFIAALLAVATGWVLWVAMGRR